jgi:DNA-binding winged helix-turn-helix (wHTH) protein
MGPDSKFVDKTSLAIAVAKVPIALTDTGQGQRYIQTVHRRGYRFVVPVTTRPPGVADLLAALAPETPQPLVTSLLDQAKARREWPRYVRGSPPLGTPTQHGSFLPDIAATDL